MAGILVGARVPASSAATAAIATVQMVVIFTTSR